MYDAVFIRYIVMPVWINKISQLFKNIQYKTIIVLFRKYSVFKYSHQYDLHIFRLEIIMSETIPSPELIVGVFMEYSYVVEVIIFK